MTESDFNNVSRTLLNAIRKFYEKEENIKAFVAVILKSKPSVVKGAYVKNVSLSTTMGPGIKLDINSFDK